MRIPFLYELPIWAIGVLLVLVLLAALEAGYRVGRWKGPAWKGFDSEGGGGVVLTSMFALLGLMLAFTYAFRVTRFDARKQAIVDEANAISTAFLRADLGPELARTELRTLLLEYGVSSELVRRVWCPSFAIWRQTWRNDGGTTGDGVGGQRFEGLTLKN